MRVAAPMSRKAAAATEAMMMVVLLVELEDLLEADGDGEGATVGEVVESVSEDEAPVRDMGKVGPLTVD
jgi:hypothetical protein